MKTLGVYLLIFSAIAAFCGFYFLQSRDSDRFDQAVIKSSKASADLSKTLENIMALEGHPMNYKSDEEQRNYEKNKKEFEDKISARQNQSLIAFGVAGFFFITAIICFAAPSSKQIEVVHDFSHPPTKLPPASTIRIAANGIDLGNFSLYSVNEMIKAGRLTLEDHYWNPAMEEWQELRNHNQFKI